MARCFIDSCGFVGVPAKANDREFRFAQAGFDVGDTDGRAKQVGDEVFGKVIHKGFCAAVAVAAGVWICAGHGTEIDHMAAFPFDHAGEYGAGHVEQPLDVRVDHGFPVSQIAGLGRIKSKSESCVVYKDVNFGKFVGKARQRSVDSGFVLHVEAESVNRCGGKFTLERFKTLGTASGYDDLPPSAAYRRAMACPKPAVAPVMSTVFCMVPPWKCGVKGIVTV